MESKRLTTEITVAEESDNEEEATNGQMGTTEEEPAAQELPVVENLPVAQKVKVAEKVPLSEENFIIVDKEPAVKQQTDQDCSPRVQTDQVDDMGPITAAFSDDELSNSDLDSGEEYEDDRYESMCQEMVSEDLLKQMKDLFEKTFYKRETICRKADINDLNKQMISLLTLSDNEVTQNNIESEFTDNDKKLIFVSKESVLSRLKASQSKVNKPKQKVEDIRINVIPKSYSKSQQNRTKKFRKPPPNNYGSTFFNRFKKKRPMQVEKNTVPKETKPSHQFTYSGANPHQRAPNPDWLPNPQPPYNPMVAANAMISGISVPQVTNYGQNASAYGSRESYIERNQNRYRDRYFASLDPNSGDALSADTDPNSSSYGQTAQRFVSRQQDHVDLF